MLWTDCLTRLRQELSDNVFAMWIRPLVAEEVEGILRLYAPNPYWTRYIQENHLELISILAEQLSEGRVRQVEILVDSRPRVFCLLMNNQQQLQLLYKVHRFHNLLRLKEIQNLLLTLQLVRKLQKETIKPTIYFFAIC